jgi:chitodextrinase
MAFKAFCARKRTMSLLACVFALSAATAISTPAQAKHTHMHGRTACRSATRTSRFKSPRHRARPRRVCRHSFASTMSRVSSPGAPSNLVAIAGDHTVALSWNASTAKAGQVAGYSIYRSNALVARVTTTTYTDTGLTDGTTYTYYVVAYGKSGNVSAPSNTVSATPVATPPSPGVFGSAGAPANTTLPVASGTTLQGQTVSATTGTWTNIPTSYTYQWQDCHDYQAEGAGLSCSNATGTGNTCTNSGTGCNYTLQSSDVGYNMRVQVTASNGSGASTPASSAGSGAPSFNQNGTMPMVLGPTTPVWKELFDGSWTTSGQSGCNTTPNKLATTGFHSPDGIPGGTWWDQLGDSYTNKFYSFTNGTSLATSPGSNVGGPAFAGTAWDDMIDGTAAANGEYGQRANQYLCGPQSGHYGNQTAYNDGRTNQGVTTWYRAEIMLAADYTPDGHSGWNHILEFHQDPSSPCCAVVAMSVITDTQDGGATINYNTAPYGRLSLKIAGGGNASNPIPAKPTGSNFTAYPNGHVTFIRGPTITRNHWYDVLLRITWSYDATGVVQWWLDGHLMATFTGSNNYYTSSGGTGYENPYYMALNYRSGCRDGDAAGNGYTPGASPPATGTCPNGVTPNISTSEIIQDNYLIGATEASVGGGP